MLSRREITTYPEPGKQVKQFAVTYAAAGLPPRTVRIPVEEWSLEAEKKLIREDIETRLKEKPEVYKV